MRLQTGRRKPELSEASPFMWPRLVSWKLMQSDHASGECGKLCAESRCDVACASSRRERRPGDQSRPSSRRHWTGRQRRPSSPIGLPSRQLPAKPWVQQWPLRGVKDRAQDRNLQSPGASERKHAWQRNSAKPSSDELVVAKHQGARLTTSSRGSESRMVDLIFLGETVL